MQWSLCQVLEDNVAEKSKHSYCFLSTRFLLLQSGFYPVPKLLGNYFNSPQQTTFRISLCQAWPSVTDLLILKPSIPRFPPLKRHGSSGSLENVKWEGRYQLGGGLYFMVIKDYVTILVSSMLILCEEDGTTGGDGQYQNILCGLNTAYRWIASAQKQKR